VCAGHAQAVLQPNNEAPTNRRTPFDLLLKAGKWGEKKESKENKTGPQRGSNNCATKAPAATSTQH